MAAEPIIQLRGVTKTYGAGATAFQALKGVDMEVAEGDFVAVMGPSGSGKSTAMNILGTLDTPTEGHYFFRGIDVGSLTRDQRALLSNGGDKSAEESGNPVRHAGTPR